jgi:hypothetical protein
MPRYAMMNGISVDNIIMADDKEATEAVLRCTLIEVDEQNPVGPMWTYDPETGKFIEPKVQETLTEE